MDCGTLCSGSEHGHVESSSFSPCRCPYIRQPINFQNLRATLSWTNRACRETSFRNMLDPAHCRFISVTLLVIRVVLGNLDVNVIWCEQWTETEWATLECFFFGARKSVPTKLKVGSWNNEKKLSVTETDGGLGRRKVKGALATKARRNSKISRKVLISQTTTRYAEYSILPNYNNRRRGYLFQIVCWACFHLGLESKILSWIKKKNKKVALAVFPKKI